MRLRASVILATYNQPRHLEKVLWGYARQSVRGFRVEIADDGSGPETRSLIERMRTKTGLDLNHVWHEDRGFRKTEILNRALLSTGADYLIFSDGDCIPRHDFVETHVCHAEPDRFLSGGAIRLPRDLTDKITIDDVRSGQIFEPGWLLRRGWKPGRRRLRLLRSAGLAAIIDSLTPTSPTWNGGNASTWRRHLLEVNGFDLEVGYGSEDRALGTRLKNLGLRGRSIRYRAPLLHLEHERPYQDPEILRQNRKLVRQLKRSGEVRARLGLAELEGRAGGD